MPAYLVGLGGFLVFVFLFAANKNKIPYFETVFLFLSSLILIFFMGTRSWYVGIDTRGYLAIFNNFSMTPFNAPVPSSISSMPGYRLLARIIGLIWGDEYQLMILLLAIISISGLFYFIHKNSKNVVMSVVYFLLLYHYFSSWNGTRQYASIAIALVAFQQYKEKKYLLFVLLFAVAVALHNITTILLLFILIDRIHWTRVKAGIFSCIILVALFLQRYVVLAFTVLFPRYATIYEDYITAGSLSLFGGEAQGRKMLVSMVFLAILAVLMWFADQQQLESRKTPKSFSLWFFSVVAILEVLIGVFFRNNTLLLRVQTPFSLLMIIFLPNVIELIENFSYRVTAYFVSILLFFVPFYIQLASLNNNGGIIPYQFFW